MDLDKPVNLRIKWVPNYVILTSWYTGVLLVYWKTTANWANRIRSNTSFVTSVLLVYCCNNSLMLSSALMTAEYLKYFKH